MVLVLETVHASGAVKIVNALHVRLFRKFSVSWVLRNKISWFDLLSKVNGKLAHLSHLFNMGSRHTHRIARPRCRWRCRRARTRVLEHAAHAKVGEWVVL